MRPTRVKQLGLHSERLGIQEDLEYLPQVDVLGDVVGNEVGEDMSLGLTQLVPIKRPHLVALPRVA